MTQDCPIGLKRKRRKKIALAVAGAGTMALAGVTTLSSSRCHTQGEVFMRTIAVEVLGKETAPPPPPPEPEEWMMGDLATDPPKPIADEPSVDLRVRHLTRQDPRRPRPPK